MHPDHCGGIPDVLRHLEVREMWISPRKLYGDCAQRLLEAASIELTPIHLVRDGDSKEFGDIATRVLLASRTFKRAPENNASVVLRVILGSRTVLLTGDIERESERDLTGHIEHADVLKVAHHGSRSSTTTDFLDAVSPRIALISCGRRNLFGHPHAETIDALQRQRIHVYRTDRNGSIDLTVDGRHLFVRREIDTPP
jgi:competence protein ComEC